MCQKTQRLNMKNDICRRSNLFSNSGRNKNPHTQLRKHQSEYLCIVNWKEKSQSEDKKDYKKKNLLCQLFYQSPYLESLKQKEADLADVTFSYLSDRSVCLSYVFVIIFDMEISNSSFPKAVLCLKSHQSEWIWSKSWCLWWASGLSCLSSQCQNLESWYKTVTGLICPTCLWYKLPRFCALLR